MKSCTLEISNGQYLDRSLNWVPFRSLTIVEGTIISIDGSSPKPGINQQIDANGGYVFPGLLDLNASLREPGDTRSGSIESETRAAAAGGVTHLCSTPDTQPVNDSKAVTKLIKELAEVSAYCKVLPMGAMTKQLKGRQLSSYGALKEAGCIGLSNGTSALDNLLTVQHCFEYAATQEIGLFVTPMVPELYQGCMHDGKVSTSIGLKGIPATAETIAVAQFIQLAEQTRVKLHFSQLTCAASVHLLKQAKDSGLNVSADVSIANLLFTHRQVEGFDSLYHCHPPLRTEEDRLALIAAVKDGTIDAISSAHRPVEEAAKQRPFAETAPGMSSLESLMPCAQRLNDQGELELAEFVKAMSVRPRSLLGMEDNLIRSGETANLTIYDPSLEWRIDANTLMSKGKNSPYLDQNMKGRVVATVCEGRLTHQLES